MTGDEYPPIQESAPHPGEIPAARVRLVAVAGEHIPPLREIRAEPEVFRWWGPVHPDFPFDEGDDTRGFAVLLGDGKVAGFVQYSEQTDPMYRHAGIDIFLTTAVHGRGYGREVVAAVAAYLVDGRGHHRLTIDPCVDNAAAIACYRSVGFREVGVMRRYERAPDGTWRDGLLMDLLAEELVRR